MSDRDWRAVMAGCDRALGSHPNVSAADALRAAADALDSHAQADRYGEGAVVESFEARLAELLGKSAAVLMPSGTMAQQIALRIHCDRRGISSVAFHPTCHLALYEHAGYTHLHGLTAELVGDQARLIALSDLTSLGVPIGALLLELPQREIGGQLPEWDDLVSQIDWARSRGAAVHLDGARLWEAAPYYGRDHSEIAGLFDTVYVSLYKGLGGIGGCILAGEPEVIAEARVWRRRHGGTLPRLFPFAAAALPGLDSVIADMPRLWAHARAVAGALRDVPGITILPDPPQTNLFHAYLQGDRDVVWERMLDLAETHGVWLGNHLDASVLPNVSKLELNLGEAALQVSPTEAAELFAAVLSG